ncbi:hypothetical protein FS749_010549 [Ceratobasidium sp. UAMH 11750]|nr:hypothetical protein FS749_010549 [Ceratobasidium sp. UAMH 11750]
MRFAPGGKRLQGGRKKDAQGKILYTHLEKLITRKRKHEYIKRHPHPFGKKYNMYFNPYSGRRADIKCYKQVPRPVGIQIG